MEKRRDRGDGSIYYRSSDDRYVASIVLPDGKRKYFYRKSKQEAREALKQAQLQLERGTYISASQETVKSYLEHWLRIKRLELKDGTYHYYRVYITSSILPTLGQIRLQKLTDVHIQALYTHLLEEEELSANTVRLIHGILRGALDAATKAKKIAANPATLVTPPRIVRKELQFLTLEQAKQLLASVRNHRFEGLLTLALATGMRQGELLALHWSDVDFEKKTVHVRRSLSYRNPEGRGYEYKEVETKTATSNRTIPLPDFALAALQRQRVQQLETRLQAPGWQERGLVFANGKGGYIDAKRLREQLKKLLEEAHVPLIRFHDLRHSAATILLAMGVNAKVIQERLGHSHISITLGVYGHVTESMQREAMSKLDDQFRDLSAGQP